MPEIYVWEVLIFSTIWSIADVGCLVANKLAPTIRNPYGSQIEAINDDLVNPVVEDTLLEPETPQEWTPNTSDNSGKYHVNRSKDFISTSEISKLKTAGGLNIGLTTGKSRMKSIFGSSGTEFISSSMFEPVFPSVKQNLASCLQRTLPCKVIPGFTQVCQAYCAVQSFPDTNPLAPVLFSLGTVLDITLKGICRPIQTVFDLGWKYLVENDNTVKSFAEWQNRMGIDVKHVAYEQVQTLADILLGQVVKHSNTPLKILRGAYEEIDFALSAVETGSEIFSSFNPGCFGLDFHESAHRLVDIFYRDPNMLDILLSGSLLVVNAGKHIPGMHQELFKSVAKASDVILGTSCGVLYWAGVRDAYCDQRAGIDSRFKIDISEPYCKVSEVEVFVTIDE